MSDVPDGQRSTLHGREVATATEDDLRLALEQAFDYRGDVTIVCLDGSKVEGYIYERTTGRTLSESYVRIIPADRNVKLTVPFADIVAVSFTGRDAAAGKSWEAWVKKYTAQKAAGETNIEIKPESLD